MQKCLGLLAALLVAGAAGCQTSPLASTGWNFQIGRPSTLSSPATVQQTVGPLAVGGIASGPMAISGISTLNTTTTGPRAMLFDAAAPVDPTPSATAPRFAAAAPPACALDDVCRQLDRIETRLNAVEKQPPAKQMPPGQ